MESKCDKMTWGVLGTGHVDTRLWLPRPLLYLLLMLFTIILIFLFCTITTITAATATITITTTVSSGSTPIFIPVVINVIHNYHKSFDNVIPSVNG